jgi:arginine deiminase
VRSTFKALCEVVRSQGIAIRELEKQLATKASKSELNSGLNIKANVADVMRTFSEVASSIESRPTHEELQSYMDEKISKSDLQVLWKINLLVLFKF